MTPGRSGRGRRIAVLKPDVGVAGGFERVAARVETTLRADGHDVTRLSVELPWDPRPRVFGTAISPEVWWSAPEYFRYLAGVEEFDRVATRRFDAVVSTQPPSTTHRHPRHLALFFHHHRVFYDLEDAWLAGGFAPDPDLHRQAGIRVRALDQPRFEAVRWFAAGSETVRRRLGHFNGIDRVSLFHAGMAVGGTAAAARRAAAGVRRDGPVLCVGRLEFPKRPELLVAAMRRLPEVPAVLAGDGGRTEWVRAVDHRLSRPGLDLDRVDETALWCCRVDDGEQAPSGWRSNVAVVGRVDDPTLEHLYATAPCVVAPALDEDYGLTAIEAMAHGAPVVVCEDGGGLADLVDHEVDGLVVAPTGAAIAAAVERILTEPDLAATLAAGALRRAAATTWARADDQIRAALAITFDEAEPDGDLVTVGGDAAADGSIEAP